MSPNDEPTSKHIKFIHIEDKPKTKVWDVVTVKFYDSIGEIRWYGPWRQYCFFAEEDTVFSRGCLSDIVRFIEYHMNLRRNVQP